MKVLGFSAGFLGVDIFFVISGYLMTVLHTDQGMPHSFYLRRARRLLPAYFATIVAILLAASFAVVPTDFQQVAEQAQFASFLLSNVGFWLHNSYFSESEFNPLLHLWSLGVECQFYLLFPLLIVLARRFRSALPLMIGASLAICLLTVLVSPKTSFFLLPMRIWEFGIGMWIAARPGPGGASKVWGIVGMIGMVLIPLLPIQGEARNLVAGHPALAALLIVCCTGLALHCRLPDALIRSAPGRCARRLGDVSYSLYLAHWPVLVLFHYVPFGGTRSAVIGIGDAATSITLIIGVTAILYHGFERPGPRLFTPVRSVLAAMALVLMGLIAPKYQLDRFDAADRRIFAAWNDRAPYRCGKIFRLRHPAETLCKVGDGDQGVVLLIGDSHADAIKQAFASTASRYGLGTYFAVDNTPLITAGLDSGWLIHEAQRRNARAVFLHYAGKNLDRRLLAETAGALARAGIPAFLILPTPEYPVHVPQQLYVVKHEMATFPGQTLAGYRWRNAVVLDAARGSGMKVIDAARLLCTPACRVTDANGNLLYFDHDHLTLRGAAILVPAIAPALAAVALRPK